LVAWTPAPVNRRGAVAPSAGATQSWLESPLVASMRRLTVQAIHLPSGEICGEPTSRTR
jgi:hypothetical protein